MTVAYVAEALDRSITDATSILHQVADEGFVCIVEPGTRAGTQLAMKIKSDRSSGPRQNW